MIATGYNRGGNNFCSAHFDVQLSGSYIYLWSGCADIYFNSGPILNDGQWHSIAIIYDGAGTVSLYVDQTLVQAATSFTAVWETPFSPIFYATRGDTNFLGGQIHFTDKLYIGSLKNILFYDYAISGTELANTNADDITTLSPTYTPSTDPTSSPTMTSSAAPTTAKPTIVILSER